jgi:hypothetical protein
MPVTHFHARERLRWASAEPHGFNLDLNSRTRRLAAGVLPLAFPYGAQIRSSVPGQPG